jgi:hypothetical protein
VTIEYEDTGGALVQIISELTRTSESVIEGH